MNQKLLIPLLLILGVLTFLHRQPNLLAASPQQANTPMPAATAEPAEENTTTAEEAEEEVSAEPTIAELAERMAVLEAEVEALHAAGESQSAGANQVTTAVYLLDTAGLHALDVRLNEESVIEPGDAGTVSRVARLLSTVDWPTELAADAEALTELLNELATALTEDDVEGAAPLATEVHEAQHDFSHAAEHWLGETTAHSETSLAGQAFRVTSAVYLLDTAGLHGLDVRLNEEGVIEPGDAGTVTRLARLLSTVDWPAELAADAEALTELLDTLAAALTADDVEGAAPLATEVHEAQHDFSHAAEHWLGEDGGEHGAESSAGEGDDHHDGEESTEDAGG